MDSWLHVVVVEDEEDGAAARAAIAWFSAGVDGDIFASTRGKVLWVVGLDVIAVGRGNELGERN